nr:MAG TPA: hypothetical protein [Caudoviricetes sp.]
MDNMLSSLLYQGVYPSILFKKKCGQSVDV